MLANEFSLHAPTRSPGPPSRTSRSSTWSASCGTTSSSAVGRRSARGTNSRGSSSCGSGRFVLQQEDLGIVQFSYYHSAATKTDQPQRIPPEYKPMRPQNSDSNPAAVHGAARWTLEVRLDLGMTFLGGSVEKLTPAFGWAKNLVHLNLRMCNLWARGWVLPFFECQTLTLCTRSSDSHFSVDTGVCHPLAPRSPHVQAPGTRPLCACMVGIILF